MAEIDRATASFRIGGPWEDTGVLTDSGAVTRALGIEPSHAHNAGDPGVGGRPWRNGLWALESPLPRERTLQVHLEWLLERLLPARERILAVLADDRRLKADFFCGLWLADPNEGLVLEPATLAGIASLRAKLDFDIYYSPRDGAPGR